jgi:hypothetical protein
MNPQRSTRRKLLFLLTGVLLTAPAGAATVTVTTTADGGPGSLRDAIAAAASGDTIDVPAGMYALTSGPLRIATGVTVAGAGAATTIIDGGGTDGVFDIRIPDAPTDFVVISGVTVRNGALNGGVQVASGTVTITDSVITGNTARTGAGIRNGYRGHLTVVRTTIASNSASFQGGGIFNEGPETLILRDSTISGNSATNAGGGIMNYAAGVAIITNTTISGNVAGEGGGVADAGGGISSFLNVTITDNTAVGSSGPTSDGDFSSHAGGILFVPSFYPNPTQEGVSFVKNTIIAGNHADMKPDCSGHFGYTGRHVIAISPSAFPSLGHNVIGNDTGCEGFFNGPGDLAGVDPMLGALADNGGPTLTHALLTGSPARAIGGAAADSTVSFTYETDFESGVFTTLVFDVSSTTACPSADQRGAVRPAGACDVGAYQVTNTPSGTNVAVQPIDSASGRAPVTLTFSDVAQPGTTTLNISAAGPPPPSAFRLGNPPTYFDVATTALFAGPIQICIDYSGISFGGGSSVRLLHHEGGGWFDVTTSLDIVNQIVCGTTYSLSPFVVVETAGDTTPPVISPQISGTLGTGGWYTSDVRVSWSVGEPESSISSSSGCEPRVITTDTRGVIITCTATSAGGTSSASVTVRRDAAAPAAACTPVVMKVDKDDDDGDDRDGPRGLFRVNGFDTMNAVTVSIGPYSLTNGAVIKLSVRRQAGVIEIGKMKRSGIRRFRVGAADAFILATDAAGNSRRAACPIAAIDRDRRSDDDKRR